jgi:hypothetical protein
MGQKVPKEPAEIDAIARQMVTDHGVHAPIIATERLNECMDQGDKYGRDDWAQVVSQVHRLLRGADLS